MKTEINLIREESVRRDWSVELVTLGAIGLTVLGVKLCKNENLKRLIDLGINFVVIPLTTYSILHTIQNLSKTREVIGVEAKGDNLFDILSELVGTNWKEILTVKCYYDLKDNFEANNREKINIMF